MSRSLLLLVLALLVLPARAGIVPAKDSILDSRAHKFLTAVADNLGTEDTVLPKGHAVATLSFSGCNVTVMVVGPVEGDAKAYARAVDAWRARQGLPGDIAWSQEDDCAAAEYRVHPGHVGMRSASTMVDLPAIRAALLAVEPRTQFAVTDAVWSKADVGLPPDATSAQGTRYWNLTAPRPGLGTATGTITLAPWVPALALAWFLLPILGVLGSFAAGVLVARNDRLPLAQRRRLYGKAVLGGTYGTLGLHGLLVIATLPTRVFEPLAQLWFGARFTLLALPIVPAFAVVPLLALPIMNRVEKRLLGPSDEEKARQEPDPAPPRKAVSSPQNRVVLAAAAVLLLMGFGLQFYADTLPRSAPYREVLKFVAFGLIMVPMIGLQFAIRKPKLAVEPETLDGLDATLRAHVGRMAARLDMAPPPSRVLTEAMYGRFGAVFDAKGVGVTVGAMEALEPGEIDFLVAHELAHEKLGHRRRRRVLVFAPAMLMLIPMGILLMGGHTAFSTPAFIFTPFLVPIALMVPYGAFLRRVVKGQEFDADRLAVTATGDPVAAGSALRKVTLNSAQPGLHDTDMAAHPAVGARLAALGVA